MKIAYIHDDKKIYTGAHHINELIINKLKEHNVFVKNVYPKTRLIDSKNHNLKGVSNILFFYSLLEQQKEILKYDLIQGTTFTPITFLPFNIPVITHFGSTTVGLLLSTPKTNRLNKKFQNIYEQLRQDNVVNTLNLKSRKALGDISDIQFFVASKSTRVIAASKKVKEELVKYGSIDKNNIVVIHNAIEDYWFDKPLAPISDLKIVFLGRIGNNAFTWKIKGLDKLIYIYKKFPNLNKIIIALTQNLKIESWLNKNIPNTITKFNLPKEKIHNLVHQYYGSISLLTSRYEGFSLSLIETMSQGLIPIAFPVGIAPEIIVNGKNGFLVNTTQEAVSRINEIINNNELRKKLSQGAYKTSLQFKADVLAKKLVALYKTILNK